METSEPEDGGGSGGGHSSSILIKHEEPDSSERDAESPDDAGSGQAILQMMSNGNGSFESSSRRDSTEEEEIYVKDEPMVIEDLQEEEEVSLSPSGNSETDRQSGSGGEDTNNIRVNRRKRKVPVKYQVTSNTNSNSTAQNDESLLLTGSGIPPPKKLPSLEALLNSNSNSNSNHYQHQQQSTPKQFAVMTKERARNQAINSMPRSTCPICGDKANGLHYGIYTCEACKNFFKRSVAIDASKAYVCKFNNSCNVNITEVDGVKMKGPRCQSCRYQACLDAGMYHSGIQRTRGGRHGYSPVKQRSNSVEKYPTIQLPNISAVMSAAVQQVSSGIIGNNKKDHNIEDHISSLEPADIVSVSMSPPSSDHTGTVDHNDLMDDSSPPNNGNHQQSTSNNNTTNTTTTPSFLSKNQIWEHFVSDNVQNEVDLLKSRANIAENLLSEKTKQLDIVQRQVALLKQHLLQADQLNKEQAITIESLKRRLTAGSSSNGQQTGNGSSGGSRINGHGSSSSSTSATIEKVLNKESSSISLTTSAVSSASVRIFENGGVTITPVVTTSPSLMSSSSQLTSCQTGSSSLAATSISSNISGGVKLELNPGMNSMSQNLLSHLLRDGHHHHASTTGNGNSNSNAAHLTKMGGADMATIEPIRESRNKS